MRPIIKGFELLREVRRGFFFFFKVKIELISREEKEELIKQRKYSGQRCFDGKEHGEYNMK